MLKKIKLWFVWYWSVLSLCVIGDKVTVVESRSLKRGRYEVTFSDGWSLRVPDFGWRPKVGQKVRLCYVDPTRRRVRIVKVGGDKFDFTRTQQVWL